MKDMSERMGRHPSRLMAFKDGLSHGAKLGASTALCVMVPIGLVGAAITLFDPAGRAEAFQTPVTFLSSIGGLLFGLGLSAFYGAVAGGLIFGFFCMLRFRNSATAPDDEPGP